MLSSSVGIASAERSAARNGVAGPSKPNWRRQPETEPPPSAGIWRHKDSSENTPSPLASDDKAYIAPAEPVSPVPSTPGPGSSQQNGSRSVMEHHDPAAHVSTTTYTTPPPRLVHMRSLPGMQPGVPAVLPPSPTLSTVSEPSAVRLRPLEHDCYRCDEDFFPSYVDRDSPLSDGFELQPVLAPLEPPYHPFQRRPTPPGMPSYEEAQARMARQRRGAGGGAAARRSGSGGGGGAAASGAGRGRRRLTFWQRTSSAQNGGGSSTAPSQQPRRGFPWSRYWPGQHDGHVAGHHIGGDGSGGGGGGHLTTRHRHRGQRPFHLTNRLLRMNDVPPAQPPVWRPPTSQHALGSHHPFLRDTQAARTTPLPPPPTARHTATAQPPSAAAAAETDARGGRAARAVTLDDYMFLQEQQQEQPPDGDGTSHPSHHHGILPFAHRVAAEGRPWGSGHGRGAPRGRRGSSGVRRIRNTVPAVASKGCGCFSCLRWCLVPWPPRDERAEEERVR